MSDLQLIIWVLALAAVGALLFGPGMWSDSWGWTFLDQLVKPRKKRRPSEPAGRAGAPQDTPPQDPDPK